MFVSYYFLPHSADSCLCLKFLFAANFLRQHNGHDAACGSSATVIPTRTAATHQFLLECSNTSFCLRLLFAHGILKADNVGARGSNRRQQTHSGMPTNDCNSKDTRTDPTHKHTNTQTHRDTDIQTYQLILHSSESTIRSYLFACHTILPKHSPPHQRSHNTTHTSTSRPTLTHKNTTDLNHAHKGGCLRLPLHGGNLHENDIGNQTEANVKTTTAHTTQLRHTHCGEQTKHNNRHTSSACSLCRSLSNRIDEADTASHKS